MANRENMDKVYVVFIGKSVLESIALIFDDYVNTLDAIKDGEQIDLDSFEDFDEYYDYVTDIKSVCDMVLLQMINYEEFMPDEEGYNGE